MSIEDRIRIRDVEVLSDAHYQLRRVTFDWLRRDGAWQTLNREVFDRGDGAAVLPYDPERRTVLLVRQFRIAARRPGCDGMLIEVIAGLLDDAEPKERIRVEAEEESGYRIDEVTKVLACYQSPGAVTERIHLFMAAYHAGMRVGDGGGHAHEGEDIEVLELSFDDAMALVRSGEICDAKTIILLQHAAATVFA